VKDCKSDSSSFLVFLVPLHFGIDKVLPHLHINFKVTEGIKSPWQRYHIGSAITLHNIQKDWRLGSFGGVAAGIPEASIACCYVSDGLEFRIFRRNCCCYAVT
jgi:hypothetical protein